MRILFFGRLAETIGREIEFDLPAGGCTVAELRNRLAESWPQLVQPSVRACIDREMAPESAHVAPDREVAFVPPLSGG